jgi:hypothetical protein
MLVETEYVHSRLGLGDVGVRLRSQPCKIAYLGASVTAQRDGYRPRLHAALCRELGQDHVPVPAGIGGVGAISGVFLMDDLVLRHRPDLCLVEFTTSDLAGGSPPDALAPALEGIVGKLRDQGCEPCFMHLYRADMDAATPGPVLATYEQVAERHGVPSVDVARWFDARVAEGAFEIRDVLRDLVHTTELGSELTADVVMRALVGKIGTVHGARPARTGALSADSFRRTRIVAADPESLKNPSAASLGTFRHYYPYVEAGVGNDLRVALDGELVGMLVVVGPDAGVIRVTTLGDSREISLWDVDCHYERLTTAIFERRYAAGVPVVISLTDNPIDYSLCRRPPRDPTRLTKRLKIIGFLVRAC